MSVLNDWSKPYHPEKATNQQLADDWRLFIAAIANLDAGKNEPFSYDDIYSLATACLKEIIKRVKKGEMNFSISEKKSPPYEKLWNAVSKRVKLSNFSILTEALPTEAIYLVSPHAELIAAGRKTMIVKSRDFSNKCNKSLILCSSGLCFGTLKMKKPRKVSRNALDQFHHLHHITPEEIREWWPDVDQFYLYELYDVVIWDQPRHAEIPQGVQTFIKNVKFIDSIKNDELEEELSKKDCATCDLEICSEECFNAHPGSIIALSKLLKSLDVKAHLITGESESDQLAPVNPSGNELGEEITLEEVMPYFKSFYRTKSYVSLVGGLCTQGKTKGDIDIFINSTFRDLVTEFRIIRMFPPEYWFRFHFHYPRELESHPGIFTNHIILFHEFIERVKDPKLVLMSSPKNLVMFKFAPLLKPAHGHYKGEEYSIDKLIEVVNAKPEWYEKGIYVEKKFDGVHVRCDVSDSDVIIFSEEGNEITKNLPTLRDELASVAKNHKIIVVGELEFWKDEKHQSRQQTTAIIHTKEVHPDEKNVILNVFDCLYYDKGIHNEPHSERLKFFKKIKDSDHIKKVGFMLVHKEAELRKAVEYYSALPGSEGAYLKRADFPYELDGKSLLNLKYKNTFSIDAKVIEIHKVKDAEAYNYLCVIGEEIPIGRTYNTSIKVGEGDIIKVEFVNLSQYHDPDTGKTWFNWWSPRPILARPDKKQPDSVDTAKKLVEASHGEIKPKPWPKRYLKDSDPYLIYPDHDKKWKGIVHCHGRGKSVHLDFRCQMNPKFATGWTLYIPKGLSKVPANYAEFKQLVDAEIMPLVKDTLSNPLKKFNCGKKAPEPIEWLSYQGMVQPGEIGATKNEPGFFYIIDSFEVQFGAQKSYFHCYFCDGKIFKGRLVFRLLKNREEWKKTSEGLMTWMAFNALKSPTPYVLSTRAVQKQWVPPMNASALPRNIRSKIPDKFQYWKAKDNRRQIRDELVAEIKKKLIKLDSASRGQFKFLKQTWRGQKVIREGPSRTQFYFVLKRNDDYFALAVNSDLSTSTSATGVSFPHAAALLNAEGSIPPGSKLNPTKATPSSIEVVDSGPALIFLSEAKFLKFALKGKKLKGAWVASKQEGSDMWSVSKSESK